MIVVATVEEGVTVVRARLGELGVEPVAELAPTATRRLVLAAVDEHDDDAERLANTLRSEGMAAVVRPDGGPRLDAWTRHTRPIPLDDRLSLCFAYSEHDRQDLRGLIELGPGGFGSGEHPATRLVIDELIANIRGGERVLDVGCGSGVLGLCALQLGASDLVAVDLEPRAIEATRRNAALNGMSDRVHASLEPLSSMVSRFDVVVANIGRAAIVELAPHLVRRVTSDGWLAVSGISSTQCELVAGFLRPLAERSRRTSGEWSAMVLVPGHDQGAGVSQVLR